ncbi:MAG: 50S ribosomal protein L2 [Candidatus Norongarragalinales archaeon]
MGTKLIQQRRGKGSPSFRAPSHRFAAQVRYDFSAGARRAQVLRFVDDPSRHTLLAEMLSDDGKRFYAVAAEGLAVGDEVALRGDSLGIGNIMELGSLPEGTPVFNLEARPGDGGRLMRSSGVAAFVVGRDEETRRVSVQLPSKKVVVFDPRCLATIGIPCGGGRTEKPFVKAGARFYAMRARNKYYPRVRGTAMSAYDHPHGGKSFGARTTISRSTPPGAKVGLVAARRTGRKRGKTQFAEVKQAKQGEGKTGK